jgi:ribosomal protein S17E
MGRIKPRRLKSVTEKTFEEHSDEYKDNFEENKAVVSQKVDVKSKKLRNRLRYEIEEERKQKVR